MTRSFPRALLAALLACGATSCGSDDRDPAAGGAADYRVGSGDSYVALGDSYTAAPHTGPGEDDDGCLRSTLNYPHRVAEATGVELADVSCSGATTDAMTGEQVTLFGTRRPPQLDALDDGTDLVSLRIGLNDLGLSTTLLQECIRKGRTDPSGSPCADAAAEAGDPEARALTAKVGARVRGVLAEIERRAPRAKVLLVGYPQIFPARRGCEQLGYADGDVAWARTVTRHLDSQIRKAAAEVGVGFIDVFSSSSGHDICATTPWVAGAVPERSGGTAYHPYAEEQEHVAQQILSELR